MSEKGFIIGSGGAQFNFKVVGGTEQPANPRENTVWVNTENKITSWVYDTLEPASPSEGMVWLEGSSLGSETAFNALKKNGINLNLIGAKQYVGGSWVHCTSSVYQNGEWKDTKYWLIKGGKVVTENVGEFVRDTSVTYSGGSLTYNADSIYISCGQLARYRTVSTLPIKSSIYTKLCLDMSGTANDKAYTILVCGSGALSISNGTTNRTVKTLDLSSVTTDKKLALDVGPTGNNSACYCRVYYYNCWLE